MGWAGAPWSSPFLSFPGTSYGAAMSYPDISAVILDASFDDLVPLALESHARQLEECSSQAWPSEGRGGLDLGDALTGDGSPLCGWGVGPPRC